VGICAWAIQQGALAKELAGSFRHYDLNEIVHARENDISDGSIELSHVKKATNSAFSRSTAPPADALTRAFGDKLKGAK
jgi:hypothetical protein